MGSAFQKFSGSTTFQPFGTTQQDLTTSQGLYNISQQHGGAVAQAANEIYHPKTGILSTIGSGLKKSFGTFIDIISTPSEIVAGIIDPTISVAEAIKTNKKVSDVLFGKLDPNATTMKKVGSFVVRTSVDILTDPLTYVTFGGAKGILGLSSLPKVSLGEKAALELGISTSGGAKVISKALSEGGADTLQYLHALIKQASGKSGLESIITNLEKKAGPLALDAKNELLKLLDETALQKAAAVATKNAGKGLSKFVETGIKKQIIDKLPEVATEQMIKELLDSPLNIDFAKRAITNLIEKSPGLTKDFIDKGGIKVLGKSILSGQRISSVTSMIPGMSLVDSMTAPVRGVLSGMFDPAVVKAGKDYIRLPEEFVQFNTQLKNITETWQLGSLKEISNIINTNKLNIDEFGKVVDALNTGLMPADARLSNVVNKFRGLDNKQVDMLKNLGQPISYLDGHVGLMMVPTETKKVSFFGSVSGKVGAVETAAHAKFISQNAGKDIFTAIPESKALLESLPNGSKYIEAIGKVSSNEETVFHLGTAINDTLDTLVNNGKTFEEAFGDKNIQALLSMQQKLNSLPSETIITVGKAGESKIIKGGKKGVEMILKQDEVAAAAGNYNWFTNNEGVVFKRVATTAKELSSVGINTFDANIVTSMAAQHLKNINQGLASEYLTNAATFFGKSESLAGSGWVKPAIASVSDAADAGLMAMERGLQTKTGEQILFHPAISQAIEETFKGLVGDPATNDFLKAFDKIQRYWKASVTSIFPAFHGRNAISNVFLNFMDLGYHAFNPATHSSAVQLQNYEIKFNKLSRLAAGVGEESKLAKNQLFELNKTIVFTDKTGMPWTFAELQKVIKENNIAFNPNIVGSLDVQGSKEAFMSSISDLHNTGFQKTKKGLNLFNQDTFIPMKYGRIVGNMIEGQARLVNFMTNLRNTGDVMHAAGRTKQFLFDYNNLTSFERNVMRRVIPFYTFTRKNLELQVRTLLTTPGRTAAELTALSTLGNVIGGGKLTKEEESALPDWVKSGINIVNRKGKDNLEIYGSLGTPIEQPFQSLQFNQLLGSITPIVRLPIEQMSGYSFFRGKMLSDITNASAFKDAPKVIQDLIGFTEIKAQTKDGKKFTMYQSLRPEMMNILLQLPPTSRVLSTLRQIETSDISTGSKLLQQTIGVRPYAFDIQREQEKREKELRNELESLLNDAGVVGQYKRVFIPKNQLK